MIPVSKTCNSLGLEFYSILEKFGCHSDQPEISSCIRLSNLYTSYILPLFAALCDHDMLEELQRLQAHIGVLKTRLAHFESENSTLNAAKLDAEEQHRSQVVQKNGLITQKQEQIDDLTEQLSSAQTQYQHLNTEATALADRYSRLEKSCTDLKNRFQEILAERNELRAIKEKMNNDQRQAQQEIQALQQERERLLQKNEHAKAKVEAIIQRLAVLGTEQDHHAQEIQQLAHPTEAGEEV